MTLPIDIYWIVLNIQKNKLKPSHLLLMCKQHYIVFVYVWRIGHFTYPYCLWFYISVIYKYGDLNSDKYWLSLWLDFSCLFYCLEEENILQARILNVICITLAIPSVSIAIPYWHLAVCIIQLSLVGHVRSGNCSFHYSNPHFIVKVPFAMSFSNYKRNCKEVRKERILHCYNFDRSYSELWCMMIPVSNLRVHTYIIIITYRYPLLLARNIY